MLEDNIKLNLNNYNNQRNNLVHHTIGEMKKTDFYKFYNDGENIITELNIIIQKELIKKGINYNK